MFKSWKSFSGAAFEFVTWLAVLWTVYEEVRHLRHYWGAEATALAGAGQYIDVAVAFILILYAAYEVLQFIGLTRGVDRYLEDRPGIDAFAMFLVMALDWGIYRDINYFYEDYLSSRGSLPFGDDFDVFAATILLLGTLKTCYYGYLSVRVKISLMREPRRER